MWRDLKVALLAQNYNLNTETNFQFRLKVEYFEKDLTPQYIGRKMQIQSLVFALSPKLFTFALKSRLKNKNYECIRNKRKFTRHHCSSR